MEPNSAVTTTDELRRVVSKYTHDINNALSIILGFSELLLSDGAGDDEHKKDLEEIHRAATEVSVLTEALRRRIGMRNER